MTAATELALDVGTVAACSGLGVSRATLYRSRSPKACTRPRRPQARALAPEERRAVIDILHEDRFADRAPQEIYSTLLDEKKYLCSPRTMYRILEAEGEVRERRDQLRHPKYVKPELVATAPKQVWTWDVTKLLGPATFMYFSLYVVLDIFSRYVVAWLLSSSRGEGGRIARRLIREACVKQGIEPGHLTVHSDRGPAGKSLTVAQLLSQLGVEQSLSRPHTSNDNAFSESQFKTLKYCPEFPDRFGSYADALGFCRRFFDRYNYEHRHSGIGHLTPASVHYGKAPAMLAARNSVLTAAYAAHPERFVRGAPRPPELPTAVWINRPAPNLIEVQVGLQTDEVQSILRSNHAGLTTGRNMEVAQ